MKRLFILIITAMLCSGFSIYAKPKIVTDSIKSNILGCYKKYNVYLPDNYGKSDKKFPVLYLLHGLYGTYKTWADYDLMFIANEMIESGMCTSMVIVMPDASGENSKHAGRHTGYHNQKGWNYEDHFIKELIPEIEKKYNVIPDKKHRAIAGLSMGGHGTVMYSFDHPEMFSSACPMSARLHGSVEVDNHHDSEYVADMKKNDFVNNFPTFSKEKLNQLKTVRWMFDCGDDDSLLSGTLLLYLQMREAGMNAELRVRNGGHNRDYWRQSLKNAMTFVSLGFLE